MTTWQGDEPVIGESYVMGKDRETCRGLLAAARDLGVDEINVRTVDGGLLVPNEVWDRFQENNAAAGLGGV